MLLTANIFVFCSKKDSFSYAEIIVIDVNHIPVKEASVYFFTDTKSVQTNIIDTMIITNIEGVAEFKTPLECYVDLSVNYVDSKNKNFSGYSVIKLENGKTVKDTVMIK